MTKDRDFLVLLERFGSPPQVLWITCGNTSNARLRQILQDALSVALKLLEQGESLVEISDAK
jgi:predicted nuclease of predicted toxin-antitoxin system